MSNLPPAWSVVSTVVSADCLVLATLSTGMPRPLSRTLDPAVGHQGDVDAGAEPRHRLVHRVVDHLPDEVVETTRAGRPDVHRRAPPHGLQALQTVMVGGVVGRARGRSGLSHRLLVPFGDTARGRIRAPHLTRNAGNPMHPTHRDPSIRPGYRSGHRLLPAVGAPVAVAGDPPSSRCRACRSAATPPPGGGETEEAARLLGRGGDPDGDPGDVAPAQARRRPGANPVAS